MVALEVGRPGRVAGLRPLERRILQNRRYLAERGRTDACRGGCDRGLYIAFDVRRKFLGKLRQGHPALARLKAAHVVDGNPEIEVFAVRDLGAHDAEQPAEFVEHSAAAASWRRRRTRLKEPVSFSAVPHGAD